MPRPAVRVAPRRPGCGGGPVGVTAADQDERLGAPGRCPPLGEQRALGSAPQAGLPCRLPDDGNSKIVSYVVIALSYVK